MRQLQHGKGHEFKEKRLDQNVMLLDPTLHPEQYSAPEATNCRDMFRVISPRKMARLTLVEAVEKRLGPSEAFNNPGQSQSTTGLRQYTSYTSMHVHLLQFGRGRWGLYDPKSTCTPPSRPQH